MSPELFSWLVAVGSWAGVLLCLAAGVLFALDGRRAQSAVHFALAAGVLIVRWALRWAAGDLS